MRAIISITAVLSLLLLSSFTKEDVVFFENNKVKIYSNNNGIRFNYKFENFEERESIKVDFFIYDASKKVLGSESSTKNKALIDNYLAKYKKKAVEMHKGKHDIEVNEENFKIVFENKNNKLVFYYYKTKIYGSETLSKSGNYEKKRDGRWYYHGEGKYLVDIYINDIQVLSKHFNVDTSQSK
jgi:hypothetical protein